jgi:hypothetical protein
MGWGIDCSQDRTDVLEIVTWACVTISFVGPVYLEEQEQTTV